MRCDETEQIMSGEEMANRKLESLSNSMNVCFCYARTHTP